MGGSGGAKPPRAEGGAGGDKVRSTSSPQVPMSGRRTHEFPNKPIFTILRLSNRNYQTRATLKKNIPVDAAPIDPEKPFRNLSRKAARLAVRWLGAALDGATGLKKQPLAYTLKVKIPELHFAGRPPNKSLEKSGRRGRRGRGVWRCDRSGPLWTEQRA